MLPVKKILWTFDGSQSSLKALATAVELAQQCEAKLYALHVIAEVPPLTETTVAISDTDVSRYELGLKKSALQTLEQASAKTIPDRVRVDYFVEMGNTAEVMLDFAKEHGVELIVMSTHGRSGLSHLMFGSVAEKVIRRSPIPVLVDPDPEGEE